MQKLKIIVGSVVVQWKSVAFDTRGPWFESNHRQKINRFFLSTVSKRRK